MTTTNPETCHETRIESLPFETRSALVEFATTASAKDSGLMDDLVQVWTDLARASSDPLNEPTADPIEALRTVRELKRKFMRARFLVRDCDSFRVLSSTDQKRISEVLFQIA
jgi:hypothetical protein